MQGESDPYVNFLRSKQDKVFYLKPYPGNAGDSLIRLGTQELLSRLGIRETVDPRRADVLVMPGGNPSMWANIIVPLWRELWRTYPGKEFVLGPSGLRGRFADWAEPIRSEGLPVTAVFARDPKSFNALREAGLPSRIETGLSHDPALQLRHATWIESYRDAATSEYTLVSFRDDHESNTRTTGMLHWLEPMLPSRLSIRVSRLGASLVRRRKIKAASRNAGTGLPFIIKEASKQSLEMFLETVNRAHVVHTDRLHVMLLAAMLGKKVYAYYAANDKLRNVYEHSLIDWADVTFVECK